MVTQRVTIYQVAERAGVSISTVSNALNKPGRVNEQTRARVLAAADELGFVPSAQAAHQARKATGRFGVMAPFTSYGSYLRRLSGLLVAATEAGVDVMVFDHESAATAMSPVLESMPVHGRLDGLVVMGLPIEAAIARRLHERGLPTIAVDADSDLFPRVVADDVQGGRLAAAHLVERGHRTFGYVLEQQVSDYESQAIQRLTGFRQVAEAAGGAGSVRVEISGNSADDAALAASRLLAGADRPTAVMAHHDGLAIGILRAARSLGLAVPDDVAVMGFDDGEAAAAADLTTVRQPFEESGRVALAMLLGDAARTVRRTTVVLDLEVVVRGSA